MKMLNISSFSRLILASSLSILPIGISSTAYAQVSGSQQVKATVKGVLQITEPNDAAFEADSSPTASQSFTVNVRSNQKDGYEIKVYSANGGKLTNSDANAKFAYTLSASGGAGNNKTNVKPSSDSASAKTLYSSKNFKNEKCSLLAGCDLTVSLDYDISALELPAGDYTDTITYEVSAK